MKATKLLLIMSVALLVLCQGSAIAQESTTELDLGEDLVRELWDNFRTQDMSALQERIAPGFQSIHEDGARDAERELELLKELNLGQYILSNFKVTKVDHAIIVTYFVSVEETIEGRRLSGKPAARLTIFLETDNGWRWIAHANLNPLE